MIKYGMPGIASFPHNHYLGNWFRLRYKAATETDSFEPQKYRAQYGGLSRQACRVPTAGPAGAQFSVGKVVEVVEAEELVGGTRKDCGLGRHNQCVGMYTQVRRMLV